MENQENQEEKQVEKKPVKKSSKSKKAVEKKTIEPPPVYRYKLNLYDARGMMKASVSRSVFSNMSRKYGDVIRSMPHDKFETVDKIQNNYRNLNKRLRFHVKRTDDEIKSIVEELVSAGLVIKK